MNPMKPGRVHYHVHNRPERPEKVYASSINPKELEEEAGEHESPEEERMEGAAGERQEEEAESPEEEMGEYDQPGMGRKTKMRKMGPHDQRRQMMQARALAKLARFHGGGMIGGGSIGGGGGGAGVGGM